ncbi:MAG: sulfite exporter TauE/SafE family protein [Clostridia bacterium]|nr:sulfite exporter TauE/SafE family protein [Clostridia bacterium]
MWYYILTGFCSGIIAGMGMGGGTLLIPMLTLLLGVEQHSAQGVNLVVFVVMGIFAVWVHIHNKLINFKMFWWLVLPAVCASIGASFLSNALDSSLLKMIFGIFLIIVAVYELIIAISRTIKRKRPILKNKL